MTQNQSKWINVSVDRENYADLKVLGDATESLNHVIGKLLAEKQDIIASIRHARARSQH